MLPKQYRLSDKDFPVVKKEGYKVFGSLFGLLVKKDKEEKEAKFGFVVSKKVDKRATVRNKVKRRLDQALLTFLPKIKSGVKVVFLARRSLIDQEFKKIKTEMTRMFKKGDLLSD